MTDIHPLHSVLIVCIVVYWFIQLARDAFHLRDVQEYFDSCSKDKGWQLYFNGSHIVMRDPELERERNRAIEIANMDPYEFGYHSYWEEVDICDINTTQIGGYLDAKYEVECGNRNF